MPAAGPYATSGEVIRRIRHCSILALLRQQFQEQVICAFTPDRDVLRRAFVPHRPRSCLPVETEQLPALARRQEGLLGETERAPRL